MFRKILPALAVPAVIAGIAVAPAIAANAATPVTATATTHVTQRADSGYGGNTWALDNLQRSVTVTLTGPDAATPTLFDYTGTISDTGTAAAVTGAISPGNQAVAIKGAPKAAVTGSGTYTFEASSQVPSSANVPAVLADGGGSTPSTTDWVEQFFPAGTTFAAVDLPTWSWSYNDTKDCQTWVDAYNGSKATSGDITGVDQCVAPAVPVLSGGHAVSVSHTRENVIVTSSAATWLKFQITGPGPINGHVGWVHAKAGVNMGVYSGLKSGHGYNVRYTPYTAKFGSPTVGAKAGSVYFITAK